MNIDPYNKCFLVLKKLNDINKSMTENDIKVLNYLNFIKNKTIELEAPEPTAFIISTMSAICKLRVELNRDILCKVFECIIKKNIINKDFAHPIKSIIYNNINISILKNSKKKKGSFNNQTTIIVDVDGNLINVKYFINGSISMTGCKNELNGLKAVKIIMEEVKKYPFIFENEKDLDYKIDDIIYNYKITMINCNYNLKFNVDRNKLYKILLKNYGIYASFAPEFYHPTKIAFMWNKSTKTEQDGVCSCTNKCKCNESADKCKCRLKCLGRDKDKKLTSADLGYKDRCCKKITMAVFENGKVIITGGHNLEQTIDTYNCMNKIFKEEYKNIVKYSINNFEKYIQKNKKNLNIMDYVSKEDNKVKKYKVKKSIIIKKNKIISKKGKKDKKDKKN
jgi:TATA-box binding protein (TBP) (component of TFIID and TFIIIB)